MNYKSLFFFIVFFNYCTSPKSVQLANTPTDQCATEATVLDYTGLDGCRFLFQLKDGTRLLPISLPDPEFLFSEKQLVQIDYRKKENIVTACLTGALPAEILCLRELKAGVNPGQLFIKRDCIDTEAPLAHAWVKKMVSRNKVIEIQRGYKEQKAYYIMIGNVNTLVFDCTGELVCEYPNGKTNTCSEKSKMFQGLTSVWAQK